MNVEFAIDFGLATNLSLKSPLFTGPSEDYDFRLTDIHRNFCRRIMKMIRDLCNAYYQ
jgi:hypothetical protein